MTDFSYEDEAIPMSEIHEPVPPLDVYLQQQKLINDLLRKVERLTTENLIMQMRLVHIKEFAQQRVSEYNKEHLGRFANSLNKVVYMCQSALNKLATYKDTKDKK